MQSNQQPLFATETISIRGSFCWWLADVVFRNGNAVHTRQISVDGDC